MGGWVRDLEPADQVALQKASVAAIAGIHGIDIADEKADFLEYDSALGETPLRRHFAVEKAYYEWTCEGAERRPDRASVRVGRGQLADRGARVADLLGRQPYRQHDVRVRRGESGGRARLGDGPHRPAGLDVGWMCFMHTFFEFVLQKYGVDTMPSMLRPEDVQEQYGEASGVDVGDLRFEMVYNAVRHASIMSRVHHRSVHFEPNVE